MRKEKGKGGKGRKPHAAGPTEEPEPLSATPTFVAAVTVPNEARTHGFRDVLVDTGAGSHLFTKEFDTSAQTVGGHRSRHGHSDR